MLETKLYNLLTGGAKKTKNNFGMVIYALILVIISLIIRIFIVYYSYNLLVPKLISTFSENPDKVLSHYRPLTYWEALILIILISSLIR